MYRLLLLSLALGCARKVTSDTVETSEIAPVFEAWVDGDETIVEAVLEVADADKRTLVKLVEGDALTATLGDASQPMETRFMGTRLHYFAEFDNAEEGQVAGFEFTRDSGEDALSSTCTFPAPVDIDYPANGAEYDHDDDIVVEWGASGNEDDWVLIEVSGSCIDTYSTEEQDHVSPIYIPGGVLGDYEEACEATLSVTRYMEGVVDPGFGGGSALCSQYASIWIEIEL